jgi:hypothetical protein
MLHNYGAYAGGGHLNLRNLTPLDCKKFRIWGQLINLVGIHQGAAYWMQSY